MNCEEYRNLIDDLIEGELNTQESAAINSHFPVCPQCAAVYRTARREKEIYASYLSDVAPPQDLWTKFQAQVNAAPENTLPVSDAVAAADWKTKIFGVFSLRPSLGFAALLVLFGAAWLAFAPQKNESIAGTQFGSVPPPAENYQNQTPDPALQNGGGSSLIAGSPAVAKTGDNIVFANKGATNQAARKPSAVIAIKTSAKTISVKKAKTPPFESRLNERQMQLVALEKAAAQQIEKTELLLRAFRNARADEGDAIDVEYERQQARRLLEKNVRLRQIAENYGDFYTQEILDKVEPFLLDIANLEKSPLPEKVSEIKKRVKSQNIIASLQTY